VNDRPEHQVLTCFSRTVLDPGKTEKVRSILRNGTDWEYLLRVAARHGVMALIYRNLQAACPDTVPEAAMAQFRKYFLANAGRNIFRTEKLREILHAFKANGVRAIPYKGPVLAESVYGDTSLRAFDDLDILVRREDVHKAKELLISTGYIPSPQLDEGQISEYVKVYNELLFTGYEGRVLVELQWEIVPDHFVFPLDSLDIWSHANDGNGKKPGSFYLPPEEMLLMLCVHGVKDSWEKLIWICDIAELLRRRQDLDWDKVLWLATATGGLRMLFLGLLLAGDLFDARLPDEVKQRIEADRTALNLGEQVKATIFRGTGETPGVFKTCLFYLRSRERWTDRAKFCFRLATRTAPGDLNLLTLPSLPGRFWNLLRHAQLAVKYGLKPLGRFLKAG
jgi:hypothetical protein